ncbi:MAG: hypothetical protein KDA89_18945, partial [Planctomycetaceae bacterium]|nr:hypothetical protein [Planctomycetaceae bacterium]
MDPDREMHLWPHEYSQVYEAFNRIFDCRGHGWANLQSVHLNLPFCGDDEFGRLHAAVRLILPLLPALAAASPMKDGRLTGMLDTRLDVYRGNSRRIPSVCGSVVPEQAFTRADYHRLIFAPMFAEIAPLDPDGVLQDEFLNARGAIARFGRGSVEIRVVDIQECPAADLAVLQATTAALQALVAQRWSTTAEQMAVPAEPLHRILLNAIRSGEQTVIDDESLLKLFGFPGSSARINELWKHLFQECSPQTDSQTRPALETILSHGPLARRLLTALGPNPDHQQQFDVYRDLTECLAWGKMFV